MDHYNGEDMLTHGVKEKEKFLVDRGSIKNFLFTVPMLECTE